MPVFDQESIIFKHLEALFKSMTLPFEMIIINDCSTDRSDREISRFINSYDINSGTCVNVKYYKNIWPWFETRCDDFAIREANGDYILEIQADMYILEKGFDKKLFDLMQTNSEIFALSARGTHKLEVVLCALNPLRGTDSSDKLIHLKLLTKIFFKIKKEIQIITKKRTKYSITAKKTISEYSDEAKQISETIFPGDKSFELCGNAGFLGNLIDLLPYENEGDVNRLISENSKRIWLGETVMRGPIIFEKKVYLDIGGFNTDAFYQGNDDHDLILRVSKLKKKVGFTPINFAAPLALGSYRKKRKIRSKIWSKVHRRIRLQAYKKSALVTKKVVMN
jgi:glycosyltransferase involved in cell wall biosynthesis